MGSLLVQGPLTHPTAGHVDIQMHEENGPDKHLPAVEPTERAPDQAAEPARQADADADADMDEDEDEEVCH